MAELVNLVVSEKIQTPHINEDENTSSSDIIQLLPPPPYINNSTCLINLSIYLVTTIAFFNV